MRVMLICFAVAGIGLRAASAAVEYSAVSIGHYTAGEDTYGYALNNAGHVAGENQPMSGVNVALYYDGVTLSALSSNQSGAEGLNNSNQIAGTEHSTNRGFVYSGGTFNYITGAISARDINDAGQVVGNTASQPYRYSGGVLTPIANLGGSEGGATAINAFGVTVGFSQVASGQYHAFRWDGGTTQDLQTLGGDDSTAWDVNASGQIVGRSATVAGSFNPVHAFMWDGTMHDLGDGGAGGTVAYAINDAGVIVGELGNRAGIYRNGTWTALDDLLPAGSGIALLSARDINDSGQIIAYGQGSGQGYQTWILTPIPEPSGIALLAAGALFWSRRGRGQR